MPVLSDFDPDVRHEYLVVGRWGNSLNSVVLIGARFHHFCGPLHIKCKNMVGLLFGSRYRLSAH